MIKKTLLTITIVALCFNTSYVSFATTLTPESQAIEEGKVKYEQLNDKITSLNSEISKLNIEIEVINNKLKDNNTAIEETDSQIKLIYSQIEEAKADIQKDQEVLDKRIRSMYKSNMTADMLIYILTSDNLLDSFNRISAISKIASLDKETINKVKEKSEFLVESADNLNKKQSDLNLLKESTLKNLASVTEKQSKQQESLQELDSEKNKVSSTIEENEEKLISHQVAIINSDSSTSQELLSAIKTLKSLLAQLSSNHVLDLANTAISDGQAKLDAIEIENSKINATNNDSVPTNNASSRSSNANSNASNGASLGTYTMSATAYTSGTITATGLKPARDPNGISTIAVDPSVIPLGSKVLVSGYGYAIASDTGGSIKGNIIDLYLNNLEECNSWGRRNVTLNLIALPGTW